MNCRYYIVDAFTNTVFKGNPAGVCLVEGELDTETMQKIAAENNLSETAFIMKRQGFYDLRWFTPELEIDLCGHATLASAFVITNFTDDDSPDIRFETLSGVLTVRKENDSYIMDFPARKPRPITVTPQMEKAIGMPVREAYLSRDMLLVVDNEQAVRGLTPDYGLLKQMEDCFAVIVTSTGNKADFVSRFFAPGAGVPEDPVTGSSHATLIPFWAERLGKNRMTAMQLSKRGGTLFCEHCGDRVKIAGKAALYLSGIITFQPVTANKNS